MMDDSVKVVRYQSSKNLMNPKAILVQIILSDSGNKYLMQLWILILTI